LHEQNNWTSQQLCEQLSIQTSHGEINNLNKQILQCSKQNIVRRHNCANQHLVEQLIVQMKSFATKALCKQIIEGSPHCTVKAICVPTLLYHIYLQAQNAKINEL